MAKWLVKSEPFKWSWEDHKKKGVEPWDGVRSYQALGNMREMSKGDEVMFYHSNKGLEIVGICSVVKEYYDDPKDEKSGLVDLKAERDMPAPVTLKEIKASGKFEKLALVYQSRLSVMPVSEAHWKALMKMSEKKAKEAA